MQDEVARFFQNHAVDIVGNHRLQEPQIEGYRAVQAHFASSSAHAILQIPVGCGKTGLMSLIPFGLSRGRVLVIAPNLEIRRGVARELDISNPDCFWRKTRVFEDFGQGPYRAELDGEANIHDCRDAHFVVTAVQDNPPPQPGPPKTGA